MQPCRVRGDISPLTRHGCGGGAVEGGAEGIEAPLLPHRHGHDLGSEAGQVRHRPQVGLGDGDDPPRDSQRLQDPPVLLRLRHHPVVGGDAQQEQVDAGHPRDHRAHEALVTGDVDHGQRPAGRKVQPGVAERDGDPPLALLREPVGVDSREGADERGLAVVDVTSGSEDQLRRGPAPPAGADAPPPPPRR